MKTVNDFNFKGKKAIIRVDYNVPVSKEGKVNDNTRIRESLPTIKKILKDGGSVVLMSHLGRPKGGFEAKYSMAPVVPVLAELLGVTVHFASDIIGDSAKEVVAKLKFGEVAMLENLRFHPEEEKGNVKYAKQLASYADVYVNDAFATAHRAHASTTTIAQFFPNAKFFGFLLANEVNCLEKVLKNAHAPFTAIIGGAKVSTKISVLKNLMSKVDNLIIGGGMAFTFTKALGGNIGKSMLEDDCMEAAKEIINEAMLKGVNLCFPSDAIVADAFDANAKFKYAKADAIEADWMGLDIGEKTIRRFSEVILNSQTILWNGPVGVFEMPNFSKGTRSVAATVVAATAKGAFSLVGGGDTVSAVNQYNIADLVSYVSTGGGAMLEYIEGKELPGVKALL